MAVVGAGLVLVGAAVILSMRGCDHEGTNVVTPTPPAVVAERPTGTLAPEAPADSTAIGAADHRALNDTLAGAWMQAAPDPVSAGVPIEKPEAKAPESPPAETVAAAALPLPMVGGPGLRFAGGRQRAVVLRLIFERPQGCEVRRDNEASFRQVVWPTEARPAPPLPATGIEEARVYAVNRGLVVYWGADDHLSLKLESTDGVDASVNGRSRTVRNLRPGAELLLDDHGD
jgi:hypothetical protein